MTEREDDIEFDFFEDEPETREPEEPQSRVRLPRGARRRGGSPTGFTPLLRLGALIAFAIVIVVLIVVWVSGSNKRTPYHNYMVKVEAIAKDSAGVGRDLADVLTTPGIKAPELQPKIAGLAQQEAQNVARAVELKPPSKLRLQQEHLVEALRFRVSGLRGLADGFGTAVGTKNVAAAALLLAGQAQRLVASDVIYADLFRDPARAVLRAQGISDVSVPDSRFVKNPDFGSPRSMVPILQRLTGASTGGVPTGVHGTGLVSVKALPSGQQLDPTTENTVRASTELGFAVTVEDTGEAQEVGVKVTLTIQQTPKPIVQTKKIDLIDPKEQKTVDFTALGPVQFATKTTLRVDVKPVPGEKSTANNSASYQVIFSLG